MILRIYEPNGGRTEDIKIVDYQIGTVASRFVTDKGSEIRLPAVTPWAVIETKEDIANRDKRPSQRLAEYPA